MVRRAEKLGPREALAMGSGSESWMGLVVSLILLPILFCVGVCEDYCLLLLLFHGQ